MAAPMTALPDDYQGRPITVVIDHTSTGVANTVTIPAGVPPLDLTKAHPIISLAYIANEAATDVSDSVTYIPTNEMARATAPDSAGEYSIASATTVQVYTVDKNGFLIMCYWAKGVKMT